MAPTQAALDKRESGGTYTPLIKGKPAEPSPLDGRVKFGQNGFCSCRLWAVAKVHVLREWAGLPPFGLVQEVKQFQFCN